ncbi:MAG: hypothetical protein PHO66_08750 [Eubacteriales bacterium]|nr:hypothetical protein [Eubacteriales bacterium]
MSQHRKLRVVAVVIVLSLLTLLLAGCGRSQIEGVAYQRLDEQTLSFELDGVNWTRTLEGRAAKIYQSGELVATVSGRQVSVLLPGGDTMSVTMNDEGKPGQATVQYGTAITQGDYTLATNAFEINRLGQRVTGNPAAPVLWMIVLLAIGIGVAVLHKGLIKLLGGNTHDGSRRATLVVWLVAVAFLAAGVIILLTLLF